MELSPDQIVYIFLVSPLCVLACVLVFVSIIALSRIKDSLLFVYLKLEMLLILVDSLINLFTFVSSCESCFTNINRYFVCIFDFYGLNYLAAVIEMTSLLMSIFAALSCFLMLKQTPTTTSVCNRLTIHFNKCNPNLIALLSLFVSAFTFSFELFVPVPTYPPPVWENTTYYCDWNETVRSTLNRVFVTLTFLISYGLLVIVLIVLNVLIVIEVRKNLSQKAIGIGKKSTSRRKNVEQKLTKLIIVDCLNFILSRFPTLVYFVFDQFLDLSQVTSLPLMSLSSVFLFLSYNINFLIFYKLNSKFKDESRRVFLLLIYPFRRFLFYAPSTN